MIKADNKGRSGYSWAGSVALLLGAVLLLLTLWAEFEWARLPALACFVLGVIMLAADTWRSRPMRDR